MPGLQGNLLKACLRGSCIPKVLDVNTAEAFLQCKQQWTKAEKAAKQLTASFKSAVDDLQKHLKSVIAEDTRAKKREANQKEKEELRKVKQDAQLAAADIKKRKLQADENKCTLFSADFKNVPKVDIIKEENIVNMDGNAWAKPWFMEQCASLDLTLIETPVQRSLAQWGAQYKKAQATAKIDAVTFPAQEKHGKEELVALFQKLHPDNMRVDVSSVPGGASFSTQCWMCGCLSALKSVATLPNHSCLVKAQVAGDVFHVMSQLESLLALFYKKKIIADQHDLMKAIEHLQTLKEEDLDALMHDGAKIVQATLKPRQVLYVPTGWLLMEMALPSVHLYGIRKSLFLSPSVMPLKCQRQVARTWTECWRSRNSWRKKPLQPDWCLEDAVILHIPAVSAPGWVMETQDSNCCAASAHVVRASGLWVKHGRARGACQVSIHMRPPGGVWWHCALLTRGACLCMHTPCMQTCHSSLASVLQKLYPAVA